MGAGTGKRECWDWGCVVLWCWGAMEGQTFRGSDGEGARQGPKEGAFLRREVPEVRLCGWKGVDKMGGGQMRSERWGPRGGPRQNGGFYAA